MRKDYDVEKVSYYLLLMLLTDDNKDNNTVCDEIKKSSRDGEMDECCRYYPQPDKDPSSLHYRIC